MTLRLTVDHARWRAHVAATADRVTASGDLVAVVKGNGYGIGRDLFYLIRHELETDGCRLIKSEVQPDEPGRISFWEELGFEVVKVQMALNLAADEEE